MKPARAKSPTRPPARSSRFTGVKVFWASVFAHRAKLGETVTQWLEAHPEIELVDMVVTRANSQRRLRRCRRDPRAPMRCAGWSAANKPTRSRE